MGSSHSVIWGSKQREDISYSDIEYKHGKLWNTLAPRDDHLSLTSVFRFCLFMGVSCNNMQNDEEQSPVAVRLPKNCLFLLKQLKNWIANNSKINSPIYKEPIYRSPGAGQQMVNARYRIVFQIKKQDALYQGANRFQMLPWDAHEPPPKRFTRDGGWYIVSIMVLKDEMDLGGQCPDNPDVHLKVILHIANRMTWTPPVVNPCLLNYHVENTLSSEELDQLVRIQKIFLPNEQSTYPKDTRTLIPGLLGAIHLDCRTLNISSNLNTVLHPSYYKSDFNLIFPNPVSSTINPNPPWFKNEAIHEDHQDVNADGKFKNCPTYTNINAGLNFPNPVPSTIIPNPRWLNNEAIHEDHQDVNANRDSKKYPLSTNNKADNRAAPGFKAFCILLLLTSPAAAYPVSTYPVSAYPVSAYPVSQGHEVEIKILRDSDNLNCTLKIDNKYFLCCGHCDQNLIHHQHISDDILENLLVNVRKELEEAMKANQISLRKKDGLRSGTLELIFLWKLIFNNTINETIQYIFNGTKLPDEEITKLPMTMISVYMEKMKDHFEELWESSREMKLPFPKIDDQPENMNSTVNAKANTRKSWIIAIPITGFAVCFIGAIAIWFVKCSGKETCKELYETCLTYRRAAQNEAEAEGDPNVMEV